MRFAARRLAASSVLLFISGNGVARAQVVRHGPMRMGPLVFFRAIAPVAVLTAQQDAPEPKKVLKPEQRTDQQEVKQMREERDRLRAQAKQAFDAEMARERAGDCSTARTTVDSNVCLSRENKTTEDHYTAYTEAIRATLRLKEPLFPGKTEEPPLSGPAGPMLTPEQRMAEFDKTERLWKSYRDAQCMAAFHQFGRGTGGPSTEMECEQRLIRGHMRDLDTVYGLVLYH